jgi:hypothetical protein
MGIKIYINELCKSDHIGDIARGIIHELSHKILLTEDYINDVQQIYGAEDCRDICALSARSSLALLGSLPAAISSTASSSSNVWYVLGLLIMLHTRDGTRPLSLALISYSA